MNLRAAVLGHPISHSKSPALHLAAYRKLGMEIGYTALDVTEQALPAFMEQVRTQGGWRGLS
ncbi:MAG TPA: shikimate dehydrogenase, partial [Arthrobacter bacterium]|nr:shikimate dehydrogenase [Arthrobacter sp.]